MRTHRTGGRRGRLLLVMAVVVTAGAVLAACMQSSAQPPPSSGVPAGAALGGSKQPSDPAGQPAPAIELRADSARASGGAVAAGGADAVYNYAPAVLREPGEHGKVRMWWCSQLGSAAPAGDDILYAEAHSVNGPFNGAGAVFSGNPGGFDGMHTCDPSVLKVGDTYYMYYTGAAGEHAHGNAIGLATSKDAVHWTRANGGAPIVGPAHDAHRDNDYGAGQPAAVYLDGWFYLMFTDTTGAVAGWNGAGQFLLRSRSPLFDTGVQALGERGFVPVAGTGGQRARSLVDAFSADLMWVEALQAFAIAHETAGGTTVTFWDREFSTNPYRPVLVPGPWQEGPGLLRLPKGHAPISQSQPCGRVPIDLVRATAIGTAGAPTGLRHFGIDVHAPAACATPERALAVLDGFAMPSPTRTMDLIVEGAIVRVQRRSVAAALARGMLESKPTVLEGVPVAARLTAGVRAVRAEGAGLGLVFDGGVLWPVRADDPRQVAALNASPVRTISRAEWDSYPAGLGLGG